MPSVQAVIKMEANLQDLCIALLQVQVFGKSLYSMELFEDSRYTQPDIV